jgi:hypothetical protein
VVGSPLPIDTVEECVVGSAGPCARDHAEHFTGRHMVGGKDLCSAMRFVAERSRSPRHREVLFVVPKGRARMRELMPALLFFGGPVVALYDLVVVLHPALGDLPISNMLGFVSLRLEVTLMGLGVCLRHRLNPEFGGWSGLALLETSSHPGAAHGGGSTRRHVALNLVAFIHVVWSNAPLNIAPAKDPSIGDGAVVDAPRDEVCATRPILAIKQAVPAAMERCCPQPTTLLAVTVAVRTLIDLRPEALSSMCGLSSPSPREPHRARAVRCARDERVRP